MATTLIQPPEHDAGQSASLHSGILSPVRQDGRGTPFPEPQVDKLRGPRLIAVWVALTSGAWVVLGGAGYGLYVVVHSFLL